MRFRALFAALLLISMANAQTPESRPETPAGPKIPADKDPVTTKSGLIYSVLTPGAADAKHPKLGDKVSVFYTGWLTDGTMFDSNATAQEPIEFRLGEVIEGWNEALVLMTPGARFKLTIPPTIGYGKRAMGRIPADSTLIFEVHLVSFESGPVMPVLKPAKPEAQKTTPSGLKYEFLCDGDGAAPVETDTVELKYAMWNPSGKLLMCSEMKGVAKGPVSAFTVKFLKEGAQLLKPGQRARFEVPATLAFGDKDQGPDLPPNTLTTWELELVRIVKPMAIPEFVKLDEAIATKTASGLMYTMVKQGTGKTPKMGDPVTVHYAGWLEDGTSFDSSFSRGDTATFSLGGVIQGWNEGLQLMKEGGSARFKIPAALAYGPSGFPPKIGPNATLIFYIELVKVGK